LRNGLLSFADTFNFSDFYLINKTFTTKYFAKNKLVESTDHEAGLSDATSTEI
jgi:hypothetical protein